MMESEEDKAARKAMSLLAIRGINKVCWVNGCEWQVAEWDPVRERNTRRRATEEERKLIRKIDLVSDGMLEFLDVLKKGIYRKKRIDMMVKYGVSYVILLKETKETKADGTEQNWIKSFSINAYAYDAQFNPIEVENVGDMSYVPYRNWLWGKVSTPLVYDVAKDVAVNLGEKDDMDRRKVEMEARRITADAAKHVRD